MAMARAAAVAEQQNFPEPGPSTSTAPIAAAGLDRKPSHYELLMLMGKADQVPVPGPSTSTAPNLLDRKPSPYELLMLMGKADQVPVPGPSTSTARIAVAGLDHKPSHYELLMRLDKADLIKNSDPSECYLCSTMIPISSGVVLINCLHTFCGTCLQTSLLESADARVACPYPYGQYECDGTLEDREVECLLGREEYENFLKRQFEALQLDQSTGEQRAILPEDLELLVTLTDASVVPNPEKFECPVCMAPYEAYEGIILRDCFHTFCRECLANSIKHADDVVVRCPFQDANLTCDSVIQDREIRSLISDAEYGAYLARSLRKAESLAVDSFHCKTPNCTGWCLVAENVFLFVCPVCSAQNCLPCKAIHPGMDCEEYQDRLNGNYELRRSEREVQALIDSGQALRCPRCTAVVQKIQGCDNVVCTICKTEICWATRGPRWGPAGRGDISGGCRCNVNGRRCHPSCRNCH